MSVRLALAGVLFAVSVVAASLPAWVAGREALERLGWPLAAAEVSRVTSGIGVALGLGFAAVARFGRMPTGWVIRLGYLFGVLAAIVIALSTQLVAGTPAGTATWLSCWVLVFPIVLAPRAEPAVIAMGLASLASPLAAWLGASMGYRAPLDPPVLAILVLPNWLCVGLSWIVARMVHDLGAQASHAKELGSYVLEEKLGSGGMGEVWRARHRMLARPAAIKIVRPDALGVNPSEDEVVKRRFEREARAIAALRSPHTVELFDFGVAEDGTFYYVMELLDGTDLEALVRRFGPQPPARVVSLLLQACNSLADAHAVGLVHRDVKPANIFLCQMGVDYDYVKVLDFGLVGLRQGTAEDHTKLTEDGVIFGTPAYLAPEAALPNGAIGPASDVYSLGCVGYWLLTGALVFEDDRPMQTILDHLKKPPPPISTRTELDVPSDLERVIMSCLEKDPTRRPADAGVLMEQLAACALADAWSLSDARRWWALHLPHERSESSLDAQPIVPRPGVKSGKKPERGRR
jgi:serine/threonine protein kinase